MRASPPPRTKQETAFSRNNSRQLQRVNCVRGIEGLDLGVGIMEAFNLAMLFIVPALLLFFGEELVKRISLGVPLPPLVIKGSSTRNRTAPTAASSSSRRPAAPTSQPEGEPQSSTGLFQNGSHALASQGLPVLDTPRSGSMTARSWQKVPAPGRHADVRTQVQSTPPQPLPRIMTFLLGQQALRSSPRSVPVFPLRTMPAHNDVHAGGHARLQLAIPTAQKPSVSLTHDTHWTHAIQAFFGELLEALAVEPGDASGFGFVVSAAKSPSPADMPKLLVKNPADVASAIASGETLIEVDGFKTSGMTAKDVKDIVSRASMRVRLTVQRLHGEPKRTVVLWRAWARPLVDLCERVTREMAASPQDAGPGAVQLEASLKHLMRALNDMTSKVQTHMLLPLLFLVLLRQPPPCSPCRAKQRETRKITHFSPARTHAGTSGISAHARRVKNRHRNPEGIRHESTWPVDP